MAPTRQALSSYTHRPLLPWNGLGSFIPSPLVVTSIHGSLLVLGELLKYTKVDFMKIKFRETCDTILKYKASSASSLWPPLPLRPSLLRPPPMVYNFTQSTTPPPHPDTRGQLFKTPFQRLLHSPCHAFSAIFPFPLRRFSHTPLSCPLGVLEIPTCICGVCPDLVTRQGVVWVPEGPRVSLHGQSVIQKTCSEGCDNTTDTVSSLADSGHVETAASSD